MLRAPQIAAFVLLMLLAACRGSSEPTGTTAAKPSEEQLFPDVIEVEVAEETGGTYRFEVTLSSPYDTNERYADAWRVRSTSGKVFAVRELTHPHPNEQPFTRSLGGVQILEGIDVVVVEGRDLVNGWGGKTVEVPLP